MGLDTSHDCWHGPYGSFLRWRCAVATAAGCIVHDAQVVMTGRWPDAVYRLPPALLVLLNHSDCDGRIAAEDCAPLADALEALLPRLDAIPGAVGYTSQSRSHGDATRQFIAGLREAAAAGEPVEFH